MSKFYNNAKSAVTNINLQKALYLATERFKELRKGALVSFDFENSRKKASEIKSDVVDHLSYYLDKFEENAEKHGTRVSYAKDSKEAKEIALNIIKNNGGKLAVKGKSMITEEIGLNDFLEYHGIETVETDLGEFIIQLAGEHPSHIVAPAIHKTKEDVGKLFSEKLNVPYTNDPYTLTKIARKQLREKFIRADVGITGANFLVADTGSVVVVTNEGNGRMVTTLPKVHIVFASVEKILPSVNDLSLFLRLLPRAATGQKISSYVSFLTGISENEKDDGRSRHIIIIDNGRSAIIAGSFKHILNCIRCGACINVCPVYGIAGGYSYNSTYPGPIGIVLSSLFDGISKRADLPFAACTLCYACQEACSVDIKLTDMIRDLRREIVQRGLAGNKLSIMMKLYAKTFSTPLLYRAAKPVIRKILIKGNKENA